MSWTECPLLFECEGDRLIGIVTQPDDATRMTETGVLIVVGGPQYRAGSHRQFTLLARQLAGQGIASFRFDYRGMGDSEGEMRNFEHIDADIRAATDIFMSRLPALGGLVIWGLCDAASAAMYYGHTDSRVRGLILLNPWVHTQAGAAKARLKHYYLGRLMQRAFWIKLISGKVRIGQSMGDLSHAARKVATSDQAAIVAPSDPRHGSPGYIARMLDGFKRFRGGVLFLLSGNDLTAGEFIALAESDRSWRKATKAGNVTWVKLDEANHTFSSEIWRNRVGEYTDGWVSGLVKGN